MTISARPGGTVVSPPDVFSLREVSRAAGVSVDEARALAEAGLVALLPSGFVAPTDAVRAVRLLRAGLANQPRPQPFRTPALAGPSRRVPLAVSGALHCAALFGLAVLATLGTTRPIVSQPLEFKPVRLVFLA